MRHIYVASSWRNHVQPMIVEALRGDGHEVYDFRNPPDAAGFGWGQLNIALTHIEDACTRAVRAVVPQDAA